MTTTDETIRELVAARVGSAPAAMTPAELVDRWQRAQAPRARRRPAMPAPGRAVAIGLATVLVLVTGLWMITGRDTGSSASQPPPAELGVKVGSYFLPSTLPDGFEMLNIHEHAGDPGRVDPASAVYEGADGARIQLVTRDEPTDRRSWEHVEGLDSRSLRWSTSNPEFVEFEVAFDDGSAVAGVMRRVADEAIAGVLAGIRRGGLEAPPLLDAPSFRLVASAESGAHAIAAEWNASWGPVDGDSSDVLSVSVRRFRSPVPVDLRVGIWNTTSQLGPWMSYEGWSGVRQTFFPEPDVEVEVLASGAVDVRAATAGLAAVEESAFAEAVAAIAGVVELAAVAGQTVTFDQGLVATVIGDVERPRGVCLEVDRVRACDLAAARNGGYTERNEIVFFDTDLLIDDRWFSIGARWDRANESYAPPVPSGAATVTIDDRTYYVIERPADAAVVTDAFGTPTFRPAR